MATALEIAEQLTIFRDAWPAQMIAANVPGASAAFTAAMGAVGIVYGDNAGSRQRSPTVNGHYIGELLDMLHTLISIRTTSRLVGS